MITSNQVTITDMMRCRERRAAIQQSYLDIYHKTVISFCMNIPGPIKTNPDIRKAFELGASEISDALSAEKLCVLSQYSFHDKTGDELLLCVDGDAASVKKLMYKIEEVHPLGRLYDIDVLAPNGTKLSRPAFRKCILCDCQAQECARSRKHSVDEMFRKITDMIQNPSLESSHQKKAGNPEEIKDFPPRSDVL